MNRNPLWQSAKGMVAAFIFAQLFSASCELLEAEPAPFIISSPVCSIGDNEPWWHAAGITFEFFNVSECDVRALTVECSIYDGKTGENPFTGNNHIGVQFSGLIPKKTKAALALPLDPYLSSIPDTPFIADSLAIRSIAYTDGSTWTDPETQIIEQLTKGAIK